MASENYPHLAKRRFSTDMVAPKHRFEAFRSRINTMFDMERLPTSDTTAEFCGAIDSVNLGSVLVSSMRTKPFQHSRSRRRLMRDFVDHMLLRVDLDPDSLSGSGLGLKIIDLGQPTQPDITPGQNVSVVIPRRLLGDAADAAASRHGLVLRDGAALVLADHLQSLMRHAEGLSPNAGLGLAEVTPALAAACLRPTADNIVRARRELSGVALNRARRVIEDHLHAPDLTPDFVARAAGLSRSALYRLFEPAGGVAAVIRETRLRAAARILARAETTLRIADVAEHFGFSSEAHFSRAFKAYFDCTPRDLRFGGRAETSSTQPGLDADPLSPVFHKWLRLI
ncbi:helix-turn-helix domain-containing protein [Rhizobium sp. TRM95796]|uniref:helix-turn-helix domain-containing protein n=1 Tax=Rhizobium sp. TRM95796 TaxID=2979862 RepID=UPI0021E77D07|nr:AraC family transcriptional regulator [Rhizobium sp. TRM95796]MCV3765073.1 AraC family transcriptional regulator [Rhizobium sp. TRM95796]